MGSIPSKELLLRAMLALNVFNARLQRRTLVFQLAGGQIKVLPLHKDP